MTEHFDLIGAARLARRYAGAPHDAPLDLFVTEMTVVREGSEWLGWNELHRGPLRVHRVPGDHDGMMRDGQVQTVAEMVSTSVKEAHRELTGN